MYLRYFYIVWSAKSEAFFLNIFISQGRDTCRYERNLTRWTLANQPEVSLEDYQKIVCKGGGRQPSWRPYNPIWRWRENKNKEENVSCTDRFASQAISSWTLLISCYTFLHLPYSSSYQSLDWHSYRLSIFHFPSTPFPLIYWSLDQEIILSFETCFIFRIWNPFFLSQ